MKALPTSSFTPGSVATSAFFSDEDAGAFSGAAGAGCSSGSDGVAMKGAT